jgi:large subunit ribosomal protein L6
MSKIAKKPILLPDGVEAAMKDGVLEFKGKSGSLTLPVLPFISVEIKDKKIYVTCQNKEDLQARANWGTMASLIKNSLEGVEKGYQKILEVEGVGYRANMEGATLVLTVGFTHPIKYAAPKGIKIELEKNMIKISGIDKVLVGQVAAEIRKFKEPEPYQGKGIRYKGEVIRRKQGKKVAGVAGA